MTQSAMPTPQGPIDGPIATEIAAGAAGTTARIRFVLADSGALNVDVESLADEDDLYAAGLTSHGTVNLMLALEQEFDVEFADSMLRRRTFESVAAIRTALGQLTGGGAQGASAGAGAA